MKEKTLVEIAVELNIEINRLRNKLNYEKRKGNVLGTKRNGVIRFNDADVEKLKKMFKIIEKSNELNIESNNQFAFLKDQLKEKDKQIFKLQQALDQQQILMKQALDDKEKLQIELTKNQNKSFWQRLFKK